MGQTGLLILLSHPQLPLPPIKVTNLYLKIGLKHIAYEEKMYFWLHLNTEII